MILSLIPYSEPKQLRKMVLYTSKLSPFNFPFTTIRFLILILCLEVFSRIGKPAVLTALGGINRLVTKPQERACCWLSSHALLSTFSCQRRLFIVFSLSSNAMHTCKRWKENMCSCFCMFDISPTFDWALAYFEKKAPCLRMDKQGQGKHLALPVEQRG